MSSWYTDGWTTYYDASTGTAKGSLAPGSSLLATDGTVDAQTVTRIQYAATGLTLGDNFNVAFPLRLTLSDWNAVRAANPTAQVYAMLAISPASAHAGTPTVQEIVANAFLGSGQLYSSAGYATPPSGASADTVLSVVGPGPAQLQPNTKYWAAVYALARTPGSGYATGRLLPSMDIAPNIGGRAISFWTNRTPAAPKIISPTGSSVVASGSDINLTIESKDADGVFGDDTMFYTDIAGVQVQYAARPSLANPNPAWIDMPFADSGGTVRKGWWIDGASANTAGEALATLAADLSVPVRCGSSTASAGKGMLPGGSWQIRVRTFDWGHPNPSLAKPLANSSGSYNPSNYPAVNTSPWSAPVIVNVTAQVPPPIPTSPRDNAAIPLDATVVLTWQYRNTAQPPYAQARRWVRIRRVGSTTWHDLAVDQVSGLGTITVTGFTLVSGNRYEWQVKVRDSDGEESDWSEVVRFWSVPEAGSGGVRPLPSDTIDGATLGVGTYRVFVYRRGGLTRVGELTGITTLEWNRVRDEISDAKIKVNDWGIDDGNLLANLRCWAHEIVIFRDNGYSEDRVWEGPITLLTYEVESVTIQAKDVMGYAYRRIIKQRMDDNRVGDTVTSRAARILQHVFAPDDPNILQYLTVMTRSDDPRQYRLLPPYSRTAYEEIDDMAANAGLDYTAVGRSIILWGTRNRLGTLPEFTDSDLGHAPIVSEYGMSMANFYAVSNGNGIFGSANRLNEDGEDPDFGLVEMLSSSWASDSEPESGTYTQEGLATVIESFEEFSERSIADRYPPPVVVRIPDNTTINPSAVISIQSLVPGVVIPLRSVATLRTVEADQKLDSVRVTVGEGKETITITLSPFSREDTEIAEGEA